MATKKLPPWLMKGKAQEKMPVGKGKKLTTPAKKMPYKKTGA